MWIVTVDAIVRSGLLAAMPKLVVIMTGSAFAVRQESNFSDLRNSDYSSDYSRVEFATGCPGLMTGHAVTFLDERVHEFKVGQRRVTARTRAIGFWVWRRRAGRHG